MITEQEKKEYNLRMKQYRDNNKLMNSYHCHNYKRKGFGFNKISIIEYLEYRKFISINILGKLKSSRISNMKEWEKHKKQNDLVFDEPKLKGNFTLDIKYKISKEFV